MRRTIALASLVVLIVSLGSCGGGSGSSSYNFNGRWLFRELVAEDPFGIAAAGGFFPGVEYTEVVQISQNGESVVLVTEGDNTMTGTCDPKAKTFTVELIGAGQRFVINGHGDNKETMSGEMRLDVGLQWCRFVWTADLLGRGIERKTLGPAEGFLQHAGGLF